MDSKLKALVKGNHGHTMGTMSGNFTPKHPQKYIGSTKVISYKSKLELSLLQIFDMRPTILRWSSEEIEIRYYDPIKQKQRSYFPDYYVEIKRKKDGRVLKLIIEAKASEFLKPPRAGTSSLADSKSIRFHTIQYVTNMAKADAARKYCAERGIRYMFVTEKLINKIRM